MKKASMTVGNRRLLKLAAFLRTLPRERFDYTSWVGNGWEGAQDLSCGTTGCALGWAATMPAFRRLGLHLGPDAAPRLGRKMPMESARLLFGLSGEEYSLFVPENSMENAATPKYVARKIERFVKQRMRSLKEG